MSLDMWPVVKGMYLARKEGVRADPSMLAGVDFARIERETPERFRSLDYWRGVFVAIARGES